MTTTVDEEEIALQLACHLIHLEGKGELETLLKAIKTKPSPYADCLAEWRRCLEEKGKTVTDKEFGKYWVNNYIRFDTCTKKERKQAGRKCSMRNFAYVMENKADIWDFNHPALAEFKAFLALFGP